MQVLRHSNGRCSTVAGSGWIGAEGPNRSGLGNNVHAMSYTPRDVHEGISRLDRTVMVQMIANQWPEGLSDEEALQRLQTLCLGACDGIQDLADDARYKALRKALLSRPDLRPLAPAFIAAQANLQAFVRHVRENKDRSQRRDMVRDQFKAFRDAVGEPRAISSARWTGRASLHENAAVVQALVPVALEALERLIADEERVHDNGGPVDADREVALQQLKSLHRALTDLIDAVEHSRPLEPAMRRLQSIKQEAKVALGRAAAALPVTASALIAFGSVVGIAEFFDGNVVISIAAGGLAGNTLKDAMLKRDPAR